LIRNENKDLLADSHNILNRLKNCFYDVFNVHDINDITQAEIHTAEPLLPEPICFDVEIDLEKL
jgi:hypothetical protein